MANFCPQCGAQLKRPGAAFCSTCGRALQPRPGPISTVSAAPRLHVQLPGQPEAVFVISRPTIAIGREPDNDLVLNSSVVSRHHAVLNFRDEAYRIRDLNSTNGTAVNGRPVTEAVLQDGDIIRIGDEQGNNVGLVFHRQRPDAAPGTIHLGRSEMGQTPVFVIGRDPSADLHLDHPTISRRHAEVRATPGGVALLHDLGSSNGTFLNGQLVAGFRPLAAGDVVQIGPYKLVYDATGFTQYAPNGNYRIDAYNLVRRVTVGSGLSRLAGGAATKRVILQDVSLSVQPKEFVALVGGSGAGKSTLLNAMSGFAPADGRVLVNGDDLYESFAAYRSILGYVPQDDIIHPQLPVRSALTYAARLRLPDAGRPEIEQRVNKVLGEVEMSEHADKQVGRLSGGQRKRVSIASELLAEPGLFFLDEPTSGLDPGLEKKMMYTMRQLADAGRTVLLVTHATANIDQCTQVAFMADGRLTYFGPPTEAQDFFDATDFADIYTRLSQPANSVSFTTEERSQQWRQLVAANPKASAAELWETCYDHSPQHQKYVAGRLQGAGLVSSTNVAHERQPDKQKVSSLSQFRVLAQRYFELIRRDTVSLIILLAVMPFIGLLLLIMAGQHDLTGKNESQVRTEIQQDILDARRDEDPGDDAEQFQGIYQIASSTQRLLFMVALAASLLGLFGAAYEIVKEAPIYRRERMVNLRIPPYLGSKVVILLAFGAVQCLLLLFVMSWKVDFPGDGIFLPAVVEMYVTLVLATLASIAMGLLISAIVRNSSTVIYIILFVLFVQIIFAGAIFEIPPAARPISYLTTTRWTLEALGSSVDIERLNRQGGGCLEPEEPLPAGLSPAASGYCDEGQTALPPTLTFNVTYDHAAGHLLGRWFVLLLFAAVFLGLTAFVQRRKDVV
ncbi:FHA domain-containing protein [Promineifilum sp.]|uniref:FHA domain-containing protein n=1 Tax=Promineifilum sp. TaxID=2664178 RepID=UPI0035B0E4CC